MIKIVLVAIVGLILGGCNFVPDRNETKENLKTENKENKDIPKIQTAVINPLNGYNQEGVATIQEVEGKIKIIIAAKSLSNTPQPVKVHLGTCSNIGEAKHSLGNLANGKLETTIDTDMETFLKEGNLIVEISKSAKEVNTYTACGEIK